MSPVEKVIAAEGRPGKLKVFGTAFRFVRGFIITYVVSPVCSHTHGPGTDDEQEETAWQ